MKRFPDLVVHADWSSDARKRWMCMAKPSGKGGFRVDAPERVGDLQDFWLRLSERAGSSRIVVGFDFPIGLPYEYARRAAVTDFREALPSFGLGEWGTFYNPAGRVDEIGLRRPFYPFRPGGARHEHLLEGLGVSFIRQLLRRCDRATPARGAASPLFWTLGAKQVGRAAIIGWRDLIAPAVQREWPPLKLWPFDGDLRDLMATDAPVVVESYPAEACVQLGLDPPGRGWSKRTKVGRMRQGGAILAWYRRRSITLSKKLETCLEDGFGVSSRGEDPFDAAVGLLAMLDVLQGRRAAGAPHDEKIRRVEGWILGL